MKPELFIKQLAEKGFALNQKQIDQFSKYYKKLIEVNEYVNLTRITDLEEVYLKHFYDSLTPFLEYPDLFKKGHICDVGAGAGFPSIPIKILVPEMQLAIVDSLNKRLKFLADLTADLDLEQVELIHGRAEDVGQNEKYREKFDLVTARAVANMATLSEYCLPLVKKGGQFLALKGPKAESELADAKKAIAVLGGQITATKSLQLPESDEERTLILLNKVKQTPKKYPRQAGTPNRKPLH
ncbi:16S rRNA (guanine(527)-N(7))-methyltransferase RsmG [Lactobacillus jensenii]|jgi:16S rRNA methyltransferase gidB|uniref:Ribosomal RNA small subunit methyltransferase G n=1 Tax=Lactobacillus jensenii TaxID=109790 RepID=A0A5N1IAD8_LACJE|nr:16S rRNA (guanine(527)-N(7))-methyltransferase RsmG [Lactobacillus jensenii]ERJ43701.1 16S rRNA methyltransferase [Lactobacillus jensenii MD IIE-70(2)]APT15274.1 16S rRNA (guanine(527)-N(7))-methyltransferase RsmG [Lactobacillus jensenii]EEQ25313.1 16S rRNA methyltransferase GidB [Lactobacillus jensenii 269-3]EEX27117.1 16S rRNA methyltransferase GidB [Lactobacillus jensenii SJ-7A-US]KAA9236111.1 16S rRNA (guanine(527)-N(7))-methyltransferase RsmG [Lactobacillus jensenii]